jgi:protein-L-isoaspartate(D-aspartate) O-methyltransferase
MHPIDDARAFYAEEIEAVAGLRDPRITDALRRVPRERFLGPGPWQMLVAGDVGGPARRETADDDPRRVYHNVALGLRPSRSIFNGQPSLLAGFIDRLGLQPGESVAHVGSGAGYYTAIMAEVVGASGRVFALELDEELRAQAETNLAAWPQVSMAMVPDRVDAVLVNAGATHPPRRWLDLLSDRGRMLVPLTVASGPDPMGGGLVLDVRRDGDTWSAVFTTPVSIYHCIGERSEDAEKQLRVALQNGSWRAVAALRVDAHERGDGCVVHTDDVCVVRGS